MNPDLKELDEAYRHAIRMDQRKTWTSGYVHSLEARLSAWNAVRDLRSRLGLDKPELDPKST